MSRLPPLCEGWRVEVFCTWRIGKEGWHWVGTNPDRKDRHWRRTGRYPHHTEAAVILLAHQSGADEVFRHSGNPDELGSLERDDTGRAQVEAAGIVVHEATP